MNWASNAFPQIFFVLITKVIRSCSFTEKFGKCMKTQKEIKTSHHHLLIFWFMSFHIFFFVLPIIYMYIHICIFHMYMLGLILHTIL